MEIEFNKVNDKFSRLSNLQRNVQARLNQLDRLTNKVINEKENLDAFKNKNIYSYDVPLLILSNVIFPENSFQNNSKLDEILKPILPSLDKNTISNTNKSSVNLNSISQTLQINQEYIDLKNSILQEYEKSKIKSINNENSNINMNQDPSLNYTKLLNSLQSTQKSISTQKINQINKRKQEEDPLEKAKKENSNLKNELINLKNKLFKIKNKPIKEETTQYEEYLANLNNDYSINEKEVLKNIQKRINETVNEKEKENLSNFQKKEFLTKQNLYLTNELIDIKEKLLKEKRNKELVEKTISSCLNINNEKLLDMFNYKFLMSVKLNAENLVNSIIEDVLREEVEEMNLIEQKSNIRNKILGIENNNILIKNNNNLDLNSCTSKQINLLIGDSSKLKEEINYLLIHGNKLIDLKEGYEYLLDKNINNRNSLNTNLNIINLSYNHLIKSKKDKLSHEALLDLYDFSEILTECKKADLKISEKYKIPYK